MGLGLGLWGPGGSLAAPTGTLAAAPGRDRSPAEREAAVNGAGVPPRFPPSRIPPQRLGQAGVVPKPPDQPLPAPHPARYRPVPPAASPRYRYQLLPAARCPVPDRAFPFPASGHCAGPSPLPRPRNPELAAGPCGYRRGEPAAGRAPAAPPPSPPTPTPTATQRGRGGAGTRCGAPAGTGGALGNTRGRGSTGWPGANRGAGGDNVDGLCQTQGLPPRSIKGSGSIKVGGVRFLKGWAACERGCECVCTSWGTEPSDSS